MTSVAAELGRADRAGALDGGQPGRRRGVYPRVRLRGNRARAVGDAPRRSPHEPRLGPSHRAGSTRPMTDRVDVRDTGSPRLPPGQIVTRKWPVLHYGTVPAFDLGDLALQVERRGRAAALAHLGRAQALPRRETVCDIHCVTRWSRYDNLFEGVPVQALLERAGVRPEAALRPGPRRAGLHDQPAAGGPRPSGQPARAEPQRRAAGAGARRAGAAAGAPPLLLEERQVGDAASSCSRRTTRASGSRTATTCAAIPGARNATGGRTRCGCGGGRGDRRLASLAFRRSTRFSLSNMAESPRRPSPEAQAEQRVKDISARRTAGRRRPRGR